HRILSARCLGTLVPRRRPLILWQSPPNFQSRATEQPSAQPQDAGRRCGLRGAIFVRLLVTTEEHFCFGIAGVYSSGPSNYCLWSGYLEVFDEVTVLARVGSNQRARREEEPADGPSVSFWALPDYQGPWHYLRSLPHLRARVRTIVARCDVFILRVPGLV